MRFTNQHAESLAFCCANSKKNIKQLQLYEILWPHHSFPKESYHPMDLDHHCTHIKSQCHMKTLLKSQPQPLPPSRLAVEMAPSRKPKVFQMGWSLPDNSDVDGTVTTASQKEGRSSRGSNLFRFFFGKDVNAPFIHHSCRWMGPICRAKRDSSMSS